MKKQLIALSVTLAAAGVSSLANAQSSADPYIDSQDAFNSSIGGYRQAFDKWSEESAVYTPNVVVFDTGALPSDDIEFAGGYNYVSENENYADPGDSPVCAQGHGLAISGIIGAKRNNGVGIAGIAEANIYMGRVVADACDQSNPATDMDNLTAAFTSLRSNNTPMGINGEDIDVIHVSHPIRSVCTTTMQNAINELVEEGVIVVSASGRNEGDYAANFAPGNCNNVISVSAHDEEGYLTPSSETGPSVDLLANATWFTEIDSGAYGNLTGSAASAAAVTGSIAFLRGLYGKEASRDEIKTVLEMTDKPHMSSNCDGLCGRGLNDLLSAISLAESVIEPVMAYGAEPNDNDSLIDNGLLGHALDSEKDCLTDTRVDAFNDDRAMCDAFKVNVLAPDLGDDQSYRMVIERKPEYATSWDDSLVETVRVIEPAKETVSSLFYHEPTYDYRVSYCGEITEDGESKTVCPFPVEITTQMFEGKKPDTCR